MNGETIGIGAGFVIQLLAFVWYQGRLQQRVADLARQVAHLQSTVDSLLLDRKGGLLT